MGPENRSLSNSWTVCYLWECSRLEWCWIHVTVRNILHKFSQYSHCLEVLLIDRRLLHFSISKLIIIFVFTTVIFFSWQCPPTKELKIYLSIYSIISLIFPCTPLCERVCFLIAIDWAMWGGPQKVWYGVSISAHICFLIFVRKCDV